MIFGVMSTSCDLIVLKSPPYVGFLSDADAIASSEIGPMIAASFGLPLRKVN